MAKANKEPSLRTQVQRILDAAVTKHRRADGSFDLSDLSSDLESAARVNPLLMDPVGWARAKAEQYDRSRRPVIDEPSFFDGESFIPTGEGRRVQMKDATSQDILAWQNILIDQNEAQQEAHTRDMRWINENLRLFYINPDCRTRGELERRLRSSDRSAA